ncbi:craniofacial development protein 2-like [Acyrthosiphon pisum]|uniref:Craniofacial development protein 2-like n=1 Tax=Acyrthosiphon pisum TaxID=7029 RepID=A0A8R1X1F1_ACYPI|nr:craniofacial development protein 2-like [Acyrthosiphon pisum]|eukprot:XP_008179988.1 PREDICTED: craniofacial development protein 2-like [Acyrthosiphon pisum]
MVKELEKYGMKCVSLQEIRWKDAGTTKISQTTIFNGECEKGHRLGTGFAVHESIIHLVKEFRDINPRIATLTLKTDNFYMVIINVHAPTDDMEEEEKEMFYAALEDTFNQSIEDIRLVLGDFNAKIGREEVYRSTIGSHIPHTNTNDNGIKLIDFALGKEMMVKCSHEKTYINIHGSRRMGDIKTKLTTS